MVTYFILLAIVSDDHLIGNGIGTPHTIDPGRADPRLNVGTNYEFGGPRRSLR
jgi:hypothetical protein